MNSSCLGTSLRFPVGLPPLPRPSADRRGMFGPVDLLSAASVHLRSWTARRATHDGEHGRHATLCLIGLSHAGLSVRICLDELDVACPFVARGAFGLHSWPSLRVKAPSFQDLGR